MASHLFGLTKDIVAYPRKGKCELRDVISSLRLFKSDLAYKPAPVHICTSYLDPTSTQGIGKICLVST
jgi:hypothetical protein